MNQTHYDLIGDIHGYADQLNSLLDFLGYAPHGETRRHPDGRKAIFLGDYIDRGPKIRETLTLVRSMVEAGDALAILGNHEFNALAYHTPDGAGGWCRPHSPKNEAQYRATLDQLVIPYPGEWAAWLDWFRTLPLFLDLGGLRAVHASWDDDAIELASSLGHLGTQQIREMVQEGTPIKRMKDTLLSGLELPLPKECAVADKAGVSRSHIRVRWWMPLANATYREAVFPSSDGVPDIKIPDEFSANVGYPSDAPPVFFGHYWLPPESKREFLAPNVACLDYSVVLGGALTGYR